MSKRASDSGQVPPDVKIRHNKYKKGNTSGTHYEPDITCLGCGMLGHDVWHCPSLKIDNSSNDKTNLDQDSNQTEMLCNECRAGHTGGKACEPTTTCDACKKIGHEIRHCHESTSRLIESGQGPDQTEILCNECKKHPSEVPCQPTGICLFCNTYRHEFRHCPMPRSPNIMDK